MRLVAHVAGVVASPLLIGREELAGAEAHAVACVSQVQRGRRARQVLHDRPGLQTRSMADARRAYDAGAEPCTWAICSLVSRASAPRVPSFHYTADKANPMRRPGSR